MKISIITLHRVPNYGSVLQTYASQEVFKSLGYDVQIIDYISERFKKNNRIKDEYRRFSFKYKNPLVYKMFSCIISSSIKKQEKVFDGFLNKYVSLSREYSSMDELEASPPDCDILCTGSDQVWNSKTNGFIEKPFYLDFSAKKKIAFSASFGRKTIEEDEKKIIEPLLKQYTGIGVREKSGMNILADMNISNCLHTLDPTLMLTKEDWDFLVNKGALEYENYILIYEFSQNSMIFQVAKELSRMTGCKIVYISYWIHKKHKEFENITLPEIEQFLWLIKNASYVVTNSFHALAFCTIFHVKFAAIYPKSFSVRLDDYLHMIGLSDRHIEDLEHIKNVLMPIDFECVDSIIKNERTRTLYYLSDITKME